MHERRTPTRLRLGLLANLLLELLPPLGRTSPASSLLSRTVSGSPRIELCSDYSNLRDHSVNALLRHLQRVLGPRIFVVVVALAVGVQLP